MWGDSGRPDLDPLVPVTAQPVEMELNALHIGFEVELDDLRLVVSHFALALDVKPRCDVCSAQEELGS